MKEFFDNFIANLGKRFASPLSICLSVLDILVTVALVLVVVLFLKRNNARRIIKYLAVVVLAGVVVMSFRDFMPVSALFFSNIVIIVILIILLLFPQQIKRALWKFSSPKYATEQYTTQYDASDETLLAAIADIVRAVQNMSKKDMGALIIVAPDNLPEHILDSGTRLNAQLTCPLIECLFNTKAPLHDGAVYIRGDKILAAGCFLPLTQQTDLDKDLGTRHRAAIGITEQYNHLAIIVSEESGIISTAQKGELERYMDSESLTDILKQFYGLKATVNQGSKRRRLMR